MGTDRDKRLKGKGGTEMAYYSGLRPEIYHVCKNCHIGNNIVPKNLREGWPRQAGLCEVCVKLQGEGKCVPSVPKPNK